MQGNRPVTPLASVTRDGDALIFSGALLRDAVSDLWRQVASNGSGVRRIDLGAVSRIDSAGLALLAELAGPALVGSRETHPSASRNDPISIVGNPQGLAELRAAYRLSPTLSFSSA